MTSQERAATARLRKAALAAAEIESTFGAPPDAGSVVDQELRDACRGLHEAVFRISVQERKL